LAKLIPDRLPDGKKMNLPNAIAAIPELQQAEASPNELISSTIKYARMLEGNVRNTGVHACGVIICRDPVSDWVPISTAEDKETGETKKIPLLKYYSVFDISQCEGMKPRFAASEPFDGGLQPDDHAEQILQDYIGRSGVTLKQARSNKAFYQPATDTIVVPVMSQFIEKAVYYSITLMMNHINSYSRESLGNKCPYDVFRFFYGDKLLKLLQCTTIPAQQVTLNKSVFRKEVAE
jgi:hypothetical protein